MTASTGKPLPDSVGRRSGLQRLRASDGAEGVISAAIAVLIMAFLGAAMWVAFNSIFRGAEESTRSQIEQIGN